MQCHISGFCTSYENTPMLKRDGVYEKERGREKEVGVCRQRGPSEVDRDGERVS